MRALSTAFLLFLVSSHLVMAVKLPPLPTWKPEDKAKLDAGELIVGSVLLADDFVMPDRDAGAAAEVVIEAVEARPDESGYSMLGENSTISGVHLLKYFGQKPEGYLIDPQQLLSMQERQDFLYLLHEHAKVSDVPVYFYLFDGKQRVPKGYSPEEVYQRLFQDKSKPVVIVYYYMGAPMRTQSALMGGHSEQVPEWQVRELLWNSADKAKEKSDVFDQLDTFLGQVSMRLFWVEELLNELVITLNGSSNNDRTLESKSVRRGRGFVWIEELDQNTKMIVLLGGSFSLLLVSLVLLWWQRRTFMFPGDGSPKRLGAERGGSCGGVLYFYDEQQPPSEQVRRFREDFF